MHASTFSRSGAYSHEAPRRGRRRSRRDQHAWAEVRVTSPDGKTTATAKDKIITVTDNGTQKTLLSVRRTRGVTGMSYSPDGKTLASLDKDGVLNLLDAATGKLLLHVPHWHGRRTVVLAGRPHAHHQGNKKTKKYDVATGKEIQ